MIYLWIFWALCLICVGIYFFITRGLGLYEKFNKYQEGDELECMALGNLLGFVFLLILPSVISVIKKRGLDHIGVDWTPQGAYETFLGIGYCILFIFTFLHLAPIPFMTIGKIIEYFEIKKKINK